MTNFPPTLASLAGSLSVLDLGADPTGARDSTAAIAAALAASPSVFVPPGSYTISATLAPAAAFHLWGLSAALTTIRLAAGSNCGMILATNLVGCSIEGLTLDGNNANQPVFRTDPYQLQPAALDCDLVRFLGGSDNAVAGCRLLNAAMCGVTFAGSTRGRVDGCYGASNGHGTYTVTTTDWPHSTTPHGPTAADFVGTDSVAELDYCDGWSLYNADRAELVNCAGRFARFPQPGDRSYPGTTNASPAGVAGYAGIYAAQSTGVTLIGFRAEYNSGFGIDIDGAGQAVADSGTIVTGCVSRNNRQGGSHANNGGIVYAGCRIVNNGSAAFAGQPNAAGSGAAYPYPYGIMLDAPNCTITGCRVGNEAGSTSQAIGLFSTTGAATGTTLTGNNLSGNAAAAVDASVSGAAGFLSSNNRSN